MYSKEVVREAVKLLAQADDYRITGSEKLKHFKKSFKFKMDGSQRGASVYNYSKMLTETWQEILTKRWERTNSVLQQITEIDKETLILNTSIRVIVGLYLDRFKKLAGMPSSVNNLKEIRKLLNSLDYLSTLILELGEKKLR